MSWLLMSALALAGPVADEAAQLRAASPELAETVAALQPNGRSRDGRPRFVIEVPAEAGPLLLERAVYGDDPLDVRVSLIGTMPGTDGWAEALTEAWPEMAAPELREMAVQLARRSRKDEVVGLLAAGLQDDAPMVRASALRAAASVPGTWAPTVRASLKHDDAGVRASAVWSLGVVGAPSDVTLLRAALGDASADVRLNALNAVERLEPGSLGGATLAALVADSDARVRARATVLQGRVQAQ